MKNLGVRLAEKNMICTLLKLENLNDYYDAGFKNSNEEVDYYTGTTTRYDFNTIKNYISKNETDETRYDFLIWVEEKLIGEVVLNEIENDQAHFRIAIFNSEHINQGLGYRSMKLVLSFAFKTLNLSRIELEVYPFNQRAIHLYEKIGFKSLGEFFDDTVEAPYDRYLIMELLKDNFKE